jgi:UDP-N-acetylmuramate: L-alanyl-gamma-D-glutamyl-meso-diaminopimelate ligase
VDDFAHHPTEVAATLQAVRQRYTDGTLWAFFEPRSATARRGAHQQIYPTAFQSADKVLICEPYKAGDLPADQRFSGQALVDALTSAGKHARCLANVEEMVEIFKKEHRPGDIAVVMSNGEFGKIQQKLKQALI